MSANIIFFFILTFLGLEKYSEEKKIIGRKFFIVLNSLLLLYFVFCLFYFFSHLVHNVTLHISRLLFIKVRLSLWSNSLLCKKK